MCLRVVGLGVVARLPRGYQTPRTHGEAMDGILSSSGSRFDPEASRALMDASANVERRWDDAYMAMPECGLTPDADVSPF